MEGCSSKENCRGWCDFFKPFIHAHLLGVMRTLLGVSVQDEHTDALLADASLLLTLLGTTTQTEMMNSIKRE